MQALRADWMPLSSFAEFMGLVTQHASEMSGLEARPMESHRSFLQRCKEAMMAGLKVAGEPI